jgi:dienelactone hydrolase
MITGIAAQGGERIWREGDEIGDREGRPSIGDARVLLAVLRIDRGKMTEDFLAVARWLKSRPDTTGKLGAVGFCFGGGVVNQLAVLWDAT